MPIITKQVAKQIYPNSDVTSSFTFIDNNPKCNNASIKVYETEDGKMWLEDFRGNIQQINFCPYTGRKARLLLDRL